MISNDGRFLFHGTGIYCLAGIVHSDRLAEGAYWGKPGEPHGPRLTEDYEIAASFISYNAYWAEGGILVLDREKLAMDYELVAYEDKMYNGTGFGVDEREIAAITPGIEPLSKYLVAFICDPALIEMAVRPDNVESAGTDCGWVPAWGQMDDDGLLKMSEAFASLSNSRFLNAIEPEGGRYPTLGNWLPAATAEIRP